MLGDKYVPKVSIRALIMLIPFIVVIILLAQLSHTKNETMDIHPSLHLSNINSETTKTIQPSVHFSKRKNKTKGTIYPSSNFSHTKSETTNTIHSSVHFSHTQNKTTDVIHSSASFFNTESEDTDTTDPSAHFSQTKNETTITIHPSLLLADYINVRDSKSFLKFPVRSKEHKDVPSRFCSPQVKLVILVASAPANYVQRLAIRATWGNSTELEPKGARIVFVLGKSKSSNNQYLVNFEADSFDDIVAEDFMDTYYNLTLKSITMLKWINLTCATYLKNDTNHKNVGPQFMFKTDDDIFVNVDRLLWIINAAPEENLIGLRVCGNAPHTHSSSRYYVPKYMYDKPVYPGYLCGWGYLINFRVVPVLLATAEDTPMMHMEDVYITGIVAGKSKLYPSNSTYFHRNPSNMSDRCGFFNSIIAAEFEPEEIIYAWRNRFQVSSCNESYQDPVIVTDSTETKKSCLFF